MKRCGTACRDDSAFVVDRSFSLRCVCCFVGSCHIGASKASIRVKGFGE